MKEKIKAYFGGTAVVVLLGYFGICVWSIMSWFHRLCGIDDSVAKFTINDDI